MSRLPPHAASFASCLLALAAAAPISAQDLAYTTTTRMELSGTVGRVVSMMGGMDEPTAERTFLQGSWMRKDTDDRSSIMDWDGGSMILLDHSARTFLRFDFARMAEQMSTGAAAGVPPRAADAPPPDQPRPEVEVTMSTDRTGRRETIAGYEAEQVLLVVEMEAAPPPGEEDAEPVAMALVTELWLSTDFPEYRMMQEMQGEAMERFRESGAGQDVAQAMAGMGSYDPRMQDAWQKNLDAMKELDGIALRTTAHFVLVPMGVTLDRDEVLASAGESLGSGAGAAVADAARKALGGLAGRFGRGRNEEPAEPDPVQSVVLRITTEISDVSTDPLDAATFAVPEGYTERTLGEVGGRPGG